MRTFRRNAILMSALSAAFAAGGAAVAAAVESTEKFLVTGALKVTHTITEQVCDFDTLDQLENYLENVGDRHNWFRHDVPAASSTDSAADVGQLAAPMSLAAIVGETTAADQIDTTAAQVNALATEALTLPAADSPADAGQADTTATDTPAA